jgi:hypothetical protein
MGFPRTFDGDDRAGAQDRAEPVKVRLSRAGGEPAGVGEHGGRALPQFLGVGGRGQQHGGRPGGVGPQVPVAEGCDAA